MYISPKYIKSERRQFLWMLPMITSYVSNCTFNQFSNICNWRLEIYFHYRYFFPLKATKSNIFSINDLCFINLKCADIKNADYQTSFTVDLIHLKYIVPFSLQPFGSGCRVCWMRSCKQAFGRPQIFCASHRSWRFRRWQL